MIPIPSLKSCQYDPKVTGWGDDNPGASDRPMVSGFLGVRHEECDHE